MKTAVTNTVSNTIAPRASDEAKLVSLLALAAGAVAMPQTSNADILYTGTNVAVSWGQTQSFTIDNLPVGAQLGFQVHQGMFSSTLYRGINIGKVGTGYLKFKGDLASAQGLVWSQVGGDVVSQVNHLFSATYLAYSGQSFSSKYLAFEFKGGSPDSTMLYGWVQLGLNNGPILTGDFPKLMISGWAYDNTGAQIPMGAVPEPGSASLLVLGALALGAKGVRSWRRNRSTTRQS
jgi:hypothetical protein